MALEKLIRSYAGRSGGPPPSFPVHNIYLKFPGPNTVNYLIGQLCHYGPAVVITMLNNHV